MKRQYLKPEIEILDIMPGLQILTGSGGDHGASVNGDTEFQGSSTSEGGGVDPGTGGTRAPGFFGDIDD